MKTSETVAAIQAAFTKAQSEMGGAVKDSSNPFFKSKYADLVAVIKAIKEPFEKNDLSYMQFPVTTPEGIGVITRINHKSGEFIESEFTLPLVKLDPQAAGSAITYARRYALQAICGVPAVDDDAEMAMVRQPQMISKKDAQELVDRINNLGRSVDKFLEPYHVQSMFDLSVEQGENAKQRMDNVEKKNGKHDQAPESSGEGRSAPQDQSAEVLSKLRKNIRSEKGAEK